MIVMTTPRLQRLFCAFAAILLLAVCLPSSAHAQAFFYDDSACENITSTNPPDFSPSIVHCIENSVEAATTILLGVISNFMKPVFSAAAVLAIAFFAIRVMSGEERIKGKAAGLALRLVLVALYSYNLNGMTRYILGSDGLMEELVSMVNANNSPWGTIDAILGNLLGIGAGVTLAQGALGIVGAALASSFSSATVGSTLTMPAIMAIVSTVLFTFDIVYTYLRAVIIVGFLIVVSPLLILLALFNYTENRVKKWTDLLIAAIITPMMVFSFTDMTLQLMDSAGRQVFRDIGVQDARMWGRMDNPVGAWIKPYDVNQARAETDAEGAAAVPIQPDAQTNMVPLLTIAADESVTVPGIDFGSNNVGVVSNLLIDFTAIWLLAAVLRHMLHMIPDIASSIASVMTSMGSPPSGTPQERIKEIFGNFKMGAGAISGAAAGGEVGNAIGGVSGRQLGGIGGAMAGIRAFGG